MEKPYFVLSESDFTFVQESVLQQDLKEQFHLFSAFLVSSVTGTWPMIRM